MRPFVPGNAAVPAAGSVSAISARAVCAAWSQPKWHLLRRRLAQVNEAKGARGGSGRQAGAGFRAHERRGRDLKLSELRGKPVVLYFYPKDDTPGCTTQACGIRDA